MTGSRDRPALKGEFAKLSPRRWLMHRLCWTVTGTLSYLATTGFAATTFYSHLAVPALLAGLFAVSGLRDREEIQTP